MCLCVSMCVSLCVCLALSLFEFDEEEECDPSDYLCVSLCICITASAACRDRLYSVCKSANQKYIRVQSVIRSRSIR